MHVIRDFAAWWFAQLAEFLPERCRRFVSDKSNAVVIAPTMALSAGIEAIEIRLRQNGRERKIGHFNPPSREASKIPLPKHKPAVLQLSASDVLQKTLMLPAVAERHLNQALAYEMDRETPFTADELLWNYEVIGRDRQARQIWVRLRMLPRARVAQLLHRLKDAGVDVCWAEVATGPKQVSCIPLFTDGNHTNQTRYRWLFAPTLACCLVLALLSAILPFIQQEMALRKLDGRIAADRATAAEAQGIREELEKVAAAADIIENERAKTGRPLAVLADLTSIVPENTYLTEFAQQRKITITGRSAAASRLISILAAAKEVKNPSFTAPVTRVEASQSEVFTITMEPTP